MAQGNNCTEVEKHFHRKKRPSTVLVIKIESTVLEKIVTVLND